MAVGDITATDEGTFVVGSTEMLTELNTLSTGATTSGGDKDTIIVVPNGNGQATIYKLARAQA
jgi:hypothetical protein